MQAQGGVSWNPGENVAKPCFGVDVIEAAGCDHCQHDGGSVGATLATGECPIPSSQSNASQSALSGVVRQADPTVVEEAGEVGPAGEHIVHRFQDLGGARESLALAQQPCVHVVEEWLARMLAHGAPLGGDLAVDGALDLEQCVEPPDGLQRDRGDGLAILSCPRGRFLDVGQLEEAPSGVRKAECRCERLVSSNSALRPL